MINLSSFFKNPFIGEEFSFATKQRFSEEHIGKLTAMNMSGLYNAILLAMVTAHQDLFGVFTDVKIAEGIQQAQTQMVDSLIKRFITAASKLNKYFEYHETNKLPIYQEFFPNGVSEFTKRTTKSNMESHIDRLVRAITTHTAEAGGAAVLAEFTDIQSSYTTARSLQLVKKAQTHSNRTVRDAKENVWADQLFANLLTIAHEFRNQPNRLSDFFDQSILRPQTKADKDGKGVLTGLVINSATGLPVNGALIHVIDGNIDDAHSKADGSYRMHRLPIGTYKVRISKEDFETAEIKVEIIDEGDTTLNIKVQPSV